MTPQQLRDLLERLGITQVGFAELLGLDGSTVRRWVMKGGTGQELGGTAAILAWLLADGRITVEDIEWARKRDDRTRRSK